MRFRSPLAVVVYAMAALALVLLGVEGPHDLGQTTLNGLVSGSYFALGAAGLTLVYGVLKLVNFAHGDFLTFAAYIALLMRVQTTAPLWIALATGAIATGFLAVGLEFVVWRPMRKRNAGMLQLILLALGLAFVIRNAIAMVAGTNEQALRVDVTSAVSFLGLRIGKTQLIVMLVGIAALLVVGLLLRQTRIGKQIRALSDNPELAETTGVDTDRIVVVTWALAGVLAGLAGVLYGSSVGSISTTLGFGLILSLFASVVVGGIGNAYGALAGGILLGVMQEWSTLVIASRLKVAVGFVVLIVVLLFRPQGLLGRARTVEQ
jgi:neutral amino acid transport system permease protein